MLSGAIEGIPQSDVSTHWCVLQHFSWGAIEGEFFETEKTALNRYSRLPMMHASMVLDPDGKQLKYYGLDGGREKEMKDWWTANREKSSTDSMGLDEMYCVASHIDWKKVEGEFFRNLDFALTCFKSLKFDQAAMIIGPAVSGGEEIEYWGARGGRDTEMLAWWKEQLEAGADDQTEVARHSHEAPVILHIYDVVDDAKFVTLNNVLRVFGAGAYHSGVEVRGREWFFGGFPEGSDAPRDAPGIGWYPPRECHFGKYRESLLMGRTALSEKSIEYMIRAMYPEWGGWKYDLLNKNCCHFANDLCQNLTGNSIPRRLFRLGDGVEGVMTMVAEGKEARGDFSGEYKFGDVTRGILHKLFGATDSQAQETSGAREGYATEASPQARDAPEGL